ncbi:MAG: prepilin-type N-terminal cleavage/methylation domain-containing protein [Patescibacteria group bacterium]
MEYRNFKKGFTLVEVLVSISILVLLMSISFANFGKADQSELLRYGARRLADSLQSAQSFAQSGTLADYPTAQSYGVHTDVASQLITLYADRDTTSGLGRWDEGKDAPMQERLSYIVRPGREILLDSIKVYRNVDDQTPFVVSSVDIAAVPPNARLIVPGLTDTAGNEVVAIHRVVFTIKQIATGKTADVVVSMLSGRIDVGY